MLDALSSQGTGRCLATDQSWRNVREDLVDQARALVRGQERLERGTGGLEAGGFGVGQIVGDAVELICSRRRGGHSDWTTPGGVIDADDTSLLDGLTREVAEETGLVVHEWVGPLYEVEILAPDMGWRLRVEVFRAVEFSGALELADPDGIVVDARFVPAIECSVHLVGSARWVHEPVGEWLSERWEGSRTFRYEVQGADRATMVVERR